MARDRPHDQQGWTTAFPDECCNFHPLRQATTVYGGTPLCAACAHQVRQSERDEEAQESR